MLNFLYNFTILIFKCGKHAEHKPRQWENELLLQFDHAIVDEWKKALFDLKCGELVKVEQTAEKERNAGFSLVFIHSVCYFMVHDLNLSLENFPVYLKRQLMDNVDLRIQALG